jgi:segregation and condensation protein B
MTDNSLVGKLEALLFIAPMGVTPAQLAEALQISRNKVEEGISELLAHYTSHGSIHGLRIQSHNGKLQLTTSPEVASEIERFLGLEATTHLSQAALEALAIISYKEPATRPQIDAIRGVNSDGVLKSLLRKGLIQEVGRAESPGRPILYSSTPEFLQQFGLNSKSELPPLSESIIEGSDLSPEEDDREIRI